MKEKEETDRSPKGPFYSWSTDRQF